MDLRELPGLAEDYPAYQELKKAVAAGGVTQLEGLPVPAKGWLLAQLQRETGRPLVIITYNAEQAGRLCADLARYGVAEDELTNLVSSTETLIFAEGAPDLGQTGQRVAALQKLAHGQARVTVGPIGALASADGAARTAQRPARTACRRRDVDIGQLEKSLVAFGYERVEAVEQAGQWTRRGGILDIFPGDARLPFRMDFFGDDIESIRPFDVETQRSVGKVEALLIAAVREIPYEDGAVAEATARSAARTAGPGSGACARPIWMTGARNTRSGWKSAWKATSPRCVRTSILTRWSITCPICIPMPSARWTICPPMPC